MKDFFYTLRQIFLQISLKHSTNINSLFYPKRQTQNDFGCTPKQCTRGYFANAPGKFYED